MGSLSSQGTDGTRTARTSAAVLTSDRLGAAWPEVSKRLHRMLASRGVDPSLNDDIVQEVAVRALDKQVPFTDPDDLYRWAATAARRLHIDHLRSDCRTTGDDFLELVADGTDVAHAAERRVALNHVWRALAVMRPGERDAILDSLEDKEARSSNVLVRRHRARASLRKAVGGVIAWLTLAHLRLRDLAQPVNAVAAAAVLTPALVLGGTPAAPPARVPARASVAPATRVTAVAARPASVTPGQATRAATPAVRHRSATVAAPADSAADDDGMQTDQQLGPIEHESGDNPDQESNLCVEWWDREWCSPVLASPSPEPGM